MIGGGLSGAHELFMPGVMKELNNSIYHLDHVEHPRIGQKAFYLDNREDMKAFLLGDSKTIQVPFTNDTITYDAMPRIGVGISQLGANKAIALGACIYALS